MAIRITQIKPEGAQKSAPSAKDYSEEKKRSAGGAASGGSGRIKITKLPEAEAPRTVAASRKTTRETERADELDKLTRPSARRTEAADEADKQNPARRTLETPTGSSLMRDMDSGTLQQEMVRQLEEAAKNGLFQRTLPEDRGGRHHSGKELSQKILRDTETAERIRSAAAGTAQGAAANAAGFLGALVAAAEKIDKQYRDEKERLGVTTHADEMNPYPRTNEEITRGNRAGVQLLEGIADTQRVKAQESTARAKKGASALGSAGVDALQIGLNLAAIVGASAAAPGAGLLLMGTQSGGAAANDYRQYAAENGQEATPYAAAGLALGGVVSAGIGSAAAKGALKYGGALVNRLGLGNSRIAQYALGALSDAAFSGGMSAANEYAKAAAYGDSYENVRTNGEDLAKDMLFQAAVGFLCRTLTSSFGRSTAAGQPERVQREYFKDIDNLDDLARAFKQYGRQYHPDRFATADAATQRQMSDIFARISAEHNAVKAELAIETAGRAAKSYGEKRGAKTPEAASAAGRTVENELMVLKRAVENGTLTGTDAAEAVQIMDAVQKSASDSPAAAQESAQGAHEGNLTPAPETGAEGALQAQKSSPAQGAGYSRQRAGGPVAPSGVSATQESKVTIAPAAGESKRNPLDAGKRVDLGRYADERNAQEISRGLNDGTLAVDADNRLYRVNENEHIDRRSSVTVGQRSMNAFQFDHPELHQYFRDAAADLAEELSYAEKGGEIVHRTSHEAGDDEYFRTKRVASERIARLLDDERIGYDDIDRAVTALIHDEGQENFAAAKRVELLLDNMLTSGYTDIHGRYVAPNENYIAAKRAIRGADAGAQVREELPLWDMPETQNRGGVYEKPQTQSTAGTEPAEAGGRRANAVGSDSDLYGGNGERRTSEPGAGGTEKLRKDAERRDQELKRSRQRAAMMQPLTSAAALDVNGGTERALVHVLPEESWDDELHSVASFARRNGVQRVTMVTGALEVDTGSGIVPVNGCINYRSGEMVLRVDSAHHTATEIARHEIGHLVTEERNVRAFMQEVRRGDAWHELYDAYEKKYAALTRNYIGMTPKDRALYVWEEILEDAYAEMDNYGQQASTYHDAAVRAVDGADAESTPAREGSERPQLRAVDKPKSRGPPEKFSIQRTQDIPYQEQIDAFYEGDLKTVGRSDDIYVTDADGSLDVLGLGGKPFFMLKRNLQKITRKEGANKNYSAHGIGEDIIRDLPDMLKDPAMVIVGGDRISVIPGRTVDTAREKAAPLLIGINPNGIVDGRSAYEIKTMYGREGFADWLGLRAKDSKIIAGNENKATALLRNVGIKITEPVAYAADLTDAILSQSEGDVKSPTLGEEIRRQIMGEENKAAAPLRNVGKQYPKPVARADDLADASVSQRKGDVKPKTRFSAEDEDGGEWDKELARMPQSVQEAVQRAAGRDNAGFRKEDFPNLDAYLSARDDRRAAEKAERLRDRSKDEFEGTEALEKLGVKIENSAGDYSNVRQLIENDKAAKQIQKETRRAIQRLGMTPKEQSFALNITSGLYVPSDIPRGMDRDKVLELADYYAAEHAMSNDLIRARRSEINDRLQEKMEDLFDEKFEGEFASRTPKKGIAPESGFALYHRTPQRSMRAIFGWDRGQKINEAIFEPVYVNEQERKRFVNRMHDEVRTFKGEDGKEDALTQRERALAQLSIEGKAVEEMVGKSEIKQQIIHAAENLLDGAEMKDAAQEFGLHGKEERELAQRYADWLETKRELDSGEVDRARVENAAAKYSGLYNEFYAAINDFLVAHGYEPIGFIKGYAPHFQPEEESGKLERALKAIGVDLGAEVGKLPASIAGLTKEFKPNKRYNPFFQHRNGKSTDYDIQKGFEKYVDYLSDVLYHTDDIMRTRAASKYFRKKYAPDEISAQIQQAEDLKFATAEEKELFLKTNDIIDSSAKMSYQAMNQAMEKYTDSLFDDVTQTTKYGDLVTWLDDYANKLAGKQLFNDRSMEREVGRMSLNVGRKLVSTFARANVAGNLSSALNQTAQLPMIAGELGPKYVAEAIGDIARGEVKGDFAARSDFLTEKHGIDYLTNTKGDKFTTALFWPLERMDYLVSSIAVRGKYRKELAEGKSEKDALRAADRWGRDMMGSRSKGTAPLTFQSKNLVSQMVNLFQVEALNSWEHVTQDLFGPGLREMEEKLGKKEASRRLAGIIVGTLLGAFILNRVDDELYGGTPAQFDVLGLLTGFLASGNGLSTNEQLGVWVDDVWQKMTGERLFGTDEDAGNDKFNLAAAAEDTIYNVSNDVPYVRNVSGLLGLGDETLPMPDIYGTFKGIGGTLSKQASGDFDSGDFWSEVGRQLMGLVGDTVPGGRQVEKFAQGVEALARGGSYQGTGDSKRLQYPVDSPLEDPFEALRAALFGKNALPEARTYWAAGGVALSAKETRAYEDLVDSGMSRKDAYDTLLKLKKMTADLTADLDKNGEPISGSKKEKVIRAIHSMPLSWKQKDLLYLGEGYSEKGLEDAPWR